MENEKLGKTISFLRKRAGYTQRELSELLDISDKAISKWERGLNYPDISLLAKLSILLDTDIESLLEGNISYCNQMWRGVMIFDDYDGIHMLLHVYDKPLVYYLLSYFLLVGIKDILILTSLDNKINMEKLFGDGEEFGINLSYYVRDNEEELKKVWYDNKSFISSYNIMVVYGKKLLYGIDLTKIFQRAMSRRKGVTLLTTQSKYGVEPSSIIFNAKRKVISSDVIFEKGLQHGYHTIPIIFCTSELTEKILLMIDDLKKLFVSCKDKDILYTEMIGRGVVLFDLQSWDGITKASEFVKNIQENQNEYISCLEEIAWRRGLITKKEFKMLGEKKAKTNYGNYILEICKD